VNVGDRVKITKYRTWTGYEGEIISVIGEIGFKVRINEEYTLTVEEDAVELVHPLIQLGREAAE
jgi:hypothetical protein